MTVIKIIKIFIRNYYLKYSERQILLDKLLRCHTFSWGVVSCKWMCEYKAAGMKLRKSTSYAQNSLHGVKFYVSGGL
jgi:hypothetical protein